MSTYEARLTALRVQLKKDQLDGFVVPICDEHMSEYVGDYAQRLGWLTGFGGSAGSAVVLSEEAAIFTDGRYTLQVREQVDGNNWQYVGVPQTSISDWLKEHTPAGARIGYDAWVHTKGWVESATVALKAKGAELVAVKSNPIDAVWSDQPGKSDAKLMVHDDRFAGQSSAEKRAAVAEWLTANGLDSTVISALDSVAWLLNVRGSDVANTPVALSFVLAHADATADLFVAPEKVGDDVRAHLGNAVRLRTPEEFVPALKAMNGKRIAVDPDRAVAAIFGAMKDGGATIVEARDPTVLPKAVKNRVESFREDTGMLHDLSFDTISATGPNGAHCHYKVDEASNRAIEPNSIYLVDSGGQYLDGTTDVTRTIWVGPGQPTAEMKDRFTRVLKGHIALALAVFPEGTRGAQLDTMARAALWQAGLDYAHGTGHGVGSFLAVHEGPQRIGKFSSGQAGTDEPLQAGMFLSNEPGYYKAGEYGIRIENLVLVEEREITGAEGRYFGFETLTFAPIDKTLVDVSLLSGEELLWWNDYHAKVLSIIAPQLDGDALAWAHEACAPLF
jgi:Xaa-Pro aminopeptidase